VATSNFPSSLDTTSALPASISDTANLNSPNHADMHEVTNDAIIEIEEKLGTGDTTASTGAVLIGTGSGASAWDTSPTFVGAVTVGSDGSGHDVVFYSATAGDSFVWDSSEEKLTITGTDGQDALAVADGNVSITDNLDVDGTLEADAITVDGTALNEYIADTVGAMVGSNTESGITVTYQDGDNTLDFTVGTLNQDTTGTAALASTITVVALNTADQTVYPLFVDGATGTQTANTDSGLTYNPSSGNLTIGGVFTADSLDIEGNIDVNGVTNLDGVDIDGHVDMAGNLTIAGDADFNGNLDVDGTTDLDAVDVDGVLTVTDGSAGAPAIAFGSDTDSGFYLYSAGNVAGSAGGSRRMQFSSSGLYAIKATNNSSSYAGWSTATGYLVAKTSSIRYKENIKDIPKEEWEKIYNLQARSFDWKESAFDDNAYDANRKDDHGFIAEEVNEHLPYAVIWDKDHESSDNEYRIQSVGYGELTPYLVEAVKDLKARIETLEG
jgi:cytoskeletal protein CcmA (bactofilin family)